MNALRKAWLFVNGILVQNDLVAIPSWIETQNAPVDYEPKFAAKRAMLRTGAGLRRGPNALAIGGGQ